MVDNTFATPLLVRPLELGAHFVVHSVTKYLAGHGDVLGGVGRHRRRPISRSLRSLSRTIGPVLGPFESYLTMRGIKTFPLRMERQCANACRVASWLASIRGWSACTSRAIRRIRMPRHRAPVPAGSVRRDGELRAEGRRQARKSSRSWTG